MRGLFRKLTIALLVCTASATLQFFLHVSFVADSLPLGWGGLLSPIGVFIEGFVFAIPFVVLFLVFQKEYYLKMLRDWRFWLFKFGLFSVLLTIAISITLPLDGGGTWLSRALAS